MKNEKIRTYIFDLSCTKQVKKALENKNVNWEDASTFEWLLDDMYKIIEKVAIDAGFDIKQQETLIADADFAELHLGQKYKSPYAEIILKSDTIDWYHNRIMEAINNDNNLLTEFLSFEDSEGKLAVIAPASQIEQAYLDRKKEIGIK